MRSARSGNTRREGRTCLRTSARSASTATACCRTAPSRARRCATSANTSAASGWPKKAGGAGFTADDEELLVLFATQAAVAIAKRPRLPRRAPRPRRPRSPGRHLSGRRGGVRRGDGSGLAQPRGAAHRRAPAPTRPHHRGPPRRGHLPARRRERVCAGHVPARQGAPQRRAGADRGDRALGARRAPRRHPAQRDPRGRRRRGSRPSWSRYRTSPRSRSSTACAPTSSAW